MDMGRDMGMDPGLRTETSLRTGANRQPTNDEMGPRCCGGPSREVIYYMTEYTHVRSTYDLDLSRDGGPRCAGPGVDPDWWHPYGRLGLYEDIAAHICLAHCPVLDACRKLVQRDPLLRSGTITAGVLWDGPVTGPVWPHAIQPSPSMARCPLRDD